jgi:hypothetical protein
MLDQVYLVKRLLARKARQNRRSVLGCLHLEQLETRCLWTVGVMTAAVHHAGKPDVTMAHTHKDTSGQVNNSPSQAANPGSATTANHHHPQHAKHRSGHESGRMKTEEHSRSKTGLKPPLFRLVPHPGQSPAPMEMMNPATVTSAILPASTVRGNSGQGQALAEASSGRREEALSDALPDWLAVQPEPDLPTERDIVKGMDVAGSLLAGRQAQAFSFPSNMTPSLSEHCSPATLARRGGRWMLAAPMPPKRTTSASI